MPCLRVEFFCSVASRLISQPPGGHLVLGFGALEYMFRAAVANAVNGVSVVTSNTNFPGNIVPPYYVARNSTLYGQSLFRFTEVKHAEQCVRKGSLYRDCTRTGWEVVAGGSSKILYFERFRVTTTHAAMCMT